MEKTQEELEQEMLQLNKQFSDFLHTKGLKAKFKVAFGNMAESAKKQHEEDKANFEAVKAKSAEENKEFVEFLRTKGFKAKFKLVVENIKKGAKEANAKTAKQIAQVQAQTQANIIRTGQVNNYSAQDLEKEFNAFLKSKGLDSEYSVVITDEVD